MTPVWLGSRRSKVALTCPYCNETRLVRTLKNGAPMASTCSSDRCRKRASRKRIAARNAEMSQHVQ